MQNIRVNFGVERLMASVFSCSKRRPFRQSNLFFPFLFHFKTKSAERKNRYDRFLVGKTVIAAESIHVLTTTTTTRPDKRIIGKNAPKRALPHFINTYLYTVDVE